MFKVLAWDVNLLNPDVIGGFVPRLQIEQQSDEPKVPTTECKSWEPLRRLAQVWMDRHVVSSHISFRLKNFSYDNSNSCVIQ